jgi:NADH dehydrogenase
MFMYLIAGATGILGGEICRQLGAAGKPFRAMVRPTSDPEKVAALESSGAELVEADLKDRGSLDRACEGATAVLSTVTSMLSQQPGDSIAAVDRDGQINLVDAAEGAGVPRYAYISFSRHIDSDAPLANAKRDVERRLEESNLGYTILRPAFFMELAFNPMLGFDAANGKIVVYGTGENKISFVSIADVASFAIEAVERDTAARQTFEVGGPEPLTQMEAVRIFEDIAGREFELQMVPEEALRQQLAGATDPGQKSFAGLSLDYATGVPVDMTESLEAVPIALTSVREYAEGFMSRIGAGAVSAGGQH